MIDRTAVSRVRSIAAGGFRHLILIAFSLGAFFPVGLVVVNSFKERTSIFSEPYRLPTPDTFSLKGYRTVLERSQFELYYFNSTVVTLSALILILFLGAMVSFALTEYDFVGNGACLLYILGGLVIPIRLGSVSLLQLVVSLGLINTLPALILVYTAQGLPMSVFVLTQFMQQIPRALKDSARVAGATEYQVFWFILPLIRPAIGTVAALTMIPIWNDLWFPLILAPGQNTQTVTLGARQFLGQFANDWVAVLAALSLSTVPMLIFYFVFSKQLIQGLTSGAIK